MSRPLADSDVFQAIADPTRRAILDRLQSGPAPVNSLADGFPQSRPAISKHLRILKDSGLVSEQRQGRERVYRLESHSIVTCDVGIMLHERMVGLCHQHLAPQ